MRVLGIDPGLTCAGWAIVVGSSSKMALLACGTIRTPQAPVPERLAAFKAQLALIMDQYSPEAVSVERVLFNSNARTAMSVGQAAGVALLLAYESGCEIAEYTPTAVKLAVAGDGRADKQAVQKMVAVLLKLDTPPKPADAADACGLAITHLASRVLARA